MKKLLIAAGCVLALSGAAKAFDQSGVEAELVCQEFRDLKPGNECYVDSSKHLLVWSTPNQLQQPDWSEAYRAYACSLLTPGPVLDGWLMVMMSYDGKQALVACVVGYGSVDPGMPL